MPAYIGVTDTLSLLLRAEQLPLTLEAETARTAIVQRALTPCYLKLLPGELVSATVSYLIGSLTVKWSPVWKHSSSALESISRIYPEALWTNLQVRLLHVSGYGDEEGVLYTGEEVARERQADEKMLEEEDAKEDAKDGKETTEEKKAKDIKDEQSELAEAREEEQELVNRAATRVQQFMRYGTLDVPRSSSLDTSEDLLFESL